MDAHWLADDAADMYDDDTVSEVSLEMGAEAGPAFEARAQAQSLMGAGPSVGPGIVAEPAAHHSGLRRFSKDHAVPDDTQKRFMIAVENDEHAAKKRVQDMLVGVRHLFVFCLSSVCHLSVSTDGYVSCSMVFSANGFLCFQ